MGILSARACDRKLIAHDRVHPFMSCPCPAGPHSSGAVAHSAEHQAPDIRPRRSPASACYGYRHSRDVPIAGAWTTISTLHCSSAKTLYGHQASPAFNDLINGFYRIFHHVFGEASKVSPRPRSASRWRSPEAGWRPCSSPAPGRCCSRRCVASTPSRRWRRSAGPSSSPCRRRRPERGT